ncbi:putative aspartic proteinase GIP2 [Silene latifolia]|uniref:putative aspartic proteinase GIP2 n=1 Tax=Silene latifolia TaxID=37657 RepID=UPI003D783D1A
MALAIMALVTSTWAQDCSSNLKEIATDCDATKTADEIATCCADISSTAATDRTCFCLLIFEAFGQEPDFVAETTELFTFCAIDGSFETLCPSLPKGANGVVGFGRGRSSLLTQFDNEFSDEVFYFPLKFALCLTSSSRSPGFAIFGKAKYELTPTIDLSKSLKFSPMIQNPNGDHRSTDYYLNVTAIKINGKIRSLLHSPSSSIRGAKQVQPVHPFGACYETKGLKVPIIELVLHKQSVSWRIFENNSMVRVNTDVVCLGFVDGGADLRAAIVIGGHQLEDNLLEFSVVNGIGFSSLRSKGISCANFNFTTVA